MMYRTTNVNVKAVSAVLLAVVAVGIQSAGAQTWQNTAAGTYSWPLAANWGATFPNAPGVAANFAVNLAGNQTVNLNQAVTIGTLTAGDTSGTSNLTIASGTGGNPLVFQGATAGAPTAINLNVGTGSNLTLSSGITLGGTSPLTMTLTGSGTTGGATISAVNFNGNTFTLEGPAQPVLAITGNLALGVGGLTGSGAFVQNGGIVSVNSNISAFTGSITVNNGQFSDAQYNLSSVSNFVIAGAFEVAAPSVPAGNAGPGKYPIGGWMSIGSGGYPAVSTLPDRLNHNGTITLCGGGYLAYNGQLLASNIAGSAVMEQVRQINFNSGMSEISIQGAFGTGVTQSSVTLLANSPTNACVRQQGATLLVGGDNGTQLGGTWETALGGVENLKFASGMAPYMIGGGGADGSQSVSIIPWMLGSTIFHPGQGGMITYGSNGVRCLTSSEYYTGTVLGAPATANVSNSSLNLGTGRTQTINAYQTDAWGNTDIGAGSTLTITSGLVQLEANGGSIGATASAAGTLNFGSAEGIIWSAFQVASVDPNVIGSVIAGSGGLTTAGTNYLILKGANTYTGKTTVGAGVLQIGDGTTANSKLGAGNVEVVPGATLWIRAGVLNAMSDAATVTLDNAGSDYFGRMQLDSGINEKVAGLVLAGIAQPDGTYGSSSSAATYKNDTYFSGSGILNVVAVPEPTSLALLGFAGLLLGPRHRRVSRASL